MIPDFDPSEVWPSNEEKPYKVLPSGVHDTDLAELKEKLVDVFKDSETRETIYDGFVRLLIKCSEVGIEQEHLVDGSYVTSKKSPEDIDMVTFLNADDLNQLEQGHRHFLSTVLNGKEETKKNYHTHSFIEVLYPENHPLYEICRERVSDWFKFWGGTRGLKDSHGKELSQEITHPKGILRLVTSAQNSFEQNAQEVR